MPSPNKWYRDPVVWIELFVIVNVGFLSLDIYLAHSINHFHHEAEYIPFWFSIAATPIVLAAICAGRTLGNEGGLARCRPPDWLVRNRDRAGWGRAASR